MTNIIQHKKLQDTTNKALSSGKSKVFCAPEEQEKPAVPALGNITESAFTYDSESLALSAFHRNYRYALRSVAKSVLGLRIGKRVNTCHRLPSFTVQNGDAVRSIKKNEHGLAYYSGFNSCGNQLQCPVCAANIAAARKDEILHALSVHRKAGFIAVLITYTSRHKRVDKLKDVLAKQRKALSRMKGSRAYIKAISGFNYRGSIRAYECTYSNKNGWHPHTHELVFLEVSNITEKQIKKLKSDIFQQWKKASLKFGLPAPTLKHGVDVSYRQSDGSDTVGSYVTKWAMELTYAHKKEAVTDTSITPWSMVKKIEDEGFNFRLANLFREYVQAFQGVALLYWSPKLKDHFGVNDLDDEEIAENPEMDVFLEVEAKHHRAINHYKKYADVLSYAETHTAEETLKYLDDLHLANEEEYRQYMEQKTALKKHISQSTQKGYIRYFG